MKSLPHKNRKVCKTSLSFPFANIRLPLKEIGQCVFTNDALFAHQTHVKEIARFMESTVCAALKIFFVIMPCWIKSIETQRDIILAMTASSISTPSRGIFRELNFAPCADYDLLRAAADAARSRDVPVHVGGIYSADVFYDERPDLNEQMTRHGILGVEMEAAELYNLAARYGVRALAVLTVSDHLIRHEALPAEDRERSFGDMVEIALEAAFA